MQKSQENPIYTVFLIDDSTKYDLSPAVIELNFADQKDQIAKSASFSVVNTQVKGQWLSSIIKVRNRVIIYADDGTKKDEVFRGFVWTKYYKSALDQKEIQIKAYDNLIYFQESEDSQYFSAGKQTEDVLSTICKSWGVTLSYNYSSITHDKLVLRGALSDIIMTDILDKVKDRTGNDYVILSIEDVVTINEVGQNDTVYQILGGNNAIFTRSEQTMDGMITKVVILGKAGKDDRLPVQATVTGNTSKYGTLQKLYDRDENMSLADAKKEANTIIQDGGTPKLTYEVQAHDIPWIRKGDLVYINAGSIQDKNMIVIGIDRSIDNKGKTMTLTVEPQ